MSDDYIDDALGFGAGFDWITPLWAMFQKARGHEEIVSISRSDYIPAKIKLDQAGIKMRGVDILGDNVIFNVDSADRDETAKLLGLESK